VGERLGNALGGFDVESRPAVPKARSRSTISVSIMSWRANSQPTLWAMVLEPAPPLAPTKAKTRPIWPALGSA
jgi:hypothetical protein